MVYPPPIYMDGAGGNDDEDGIDTFFRPIHGVSHPFRFAYGSRYYLLRTKLLRALHSSGFNASRYYLLRKQK